MCSVPVWNYGKLFNFSGASPLQNITSSGQASFNQKILDVEMSNFGYGYTSAPTVSFSGGVSGAAGTAKRGCYNNIRREITLFFTATVTVQNGGNLFINGGTMSAVNGSSLTLVSTDGQNWSEKARAF